MKKYTTLLRVKASRIVAVFHNGVYLNFDAWSKGLAAHSIWKQDVNSSTLPLFDHFSFSLEGTLLMLCLSCLEESGKLVVQEMYSFNTILSLQLVFRNNGGEKRDLSQYTMRNLLLPLSFYLEA